MTKNVLIVDDSSLARRTVRQAIEELGHTVEEATDGAQALERYFINRHDLVILDMVMNGMYGLDVLAKLHELNPEVRIVVLTADIQKSTLEHARSAGASAFINKPVNRQELARVISAVLSGGNGWT
jgi:two-component system, chemotaxis family, chemotaxis protein CheY